jgi:DNA polymerase I-like protein with 3'-5' exonuclease and polymerase domains
VYHDNPLKRGRFLMTVHDENVISIKLEHLFSEIEVLGAAMEQLPGFDVPFIVEFEYGPNWHDLEKHERQVH